MSAKFILRRSKDGQFYFVLTAANNKVIATSEMYTTKAAAQKGIHSVRGSSLTARTVDST